MKSPLFSAILTFTSIWFPNMVTMVTGESPPWRRTALIYQNLNRTEDQWRRHVMRIDAGGNYNLNEQLFDAAIITLNTDMELPLDKLNEKSLQEILSNLFSQASKLEDALRYFSSSSKSRQMYLTIGVPYFPLKDLTLTLGGQNYRLMVPSERDGAAMWYVKKVKEMAAAKNFQYLKLYGTYYHREDVLEYNDDVRFIRSINDATKKQLGMRTCWIPYYDAPFAWHNEKQETHLGFDVTIVQPRYAFLSSIDSGDLKGDRLYSAGTRSAQLNQNFEYELRSHGESTIEYYVAHQYLAVSQTTGASNYPQAFFVGGDQDLFDRLGQSDLPQNVWKTYQDLANYLRGDTIWNFEVGISWTPQTIRSDLQQVVWTVPDGYDNLNSIRLDFSDQDPNNPGANNWRGALLVQVPTAGNVKTSFAQRMGYEKVNPAYNSVFVPIGNLKTQKGTQLIIQMTREGSSPWPKVIRLVAAKFEPPTIATAIFQEFSNTTRPNPKYIDYSDSVPTHLRFGAGKLTDGKKSQIGGWWSKNLVIGWNWIEYPFSITIDLGTIKSVSGVKLWTHIDIPSGVNLPHKIGALFSPTCEPHSRGVLNSSCLPTASSGTLKIEGGGEKGGTTRTMLLTLGNETSRRRQGGGKSATVPMTTPARFVTISGLSLAWFLVDEIEILDANNGVLSQNRMYKITPVTGPLNGGGGEDSAFADNNGRLVDGNVFSEWIYGTGSDGITALSSDNGGAAETTWAGKGREGNWAVVWITNSKISWGIRYPDWIFIQLRTGNKWQNDGVKVKPENCGPAFCGRLQIPRGMAVTGIRATFPPMTWFMVSEISIE